MKTIGLSVARTHFSALLGEVELGEEIAITRHGRAVARLVPIDSISSDGLVDTVARLKALRRGRRLGEVSVKALIEDGRR